MKQPRERERAKSDMVNSIEESTVYIFCETITSLINHLSARFSRIKTKFSSY
jgi:hypothetical protein